MDIINVIEVKDNVVHSIESYPIYEDQLRSDVIKKAEEDFTVKAMELGADVEHIDYLLEEGWWEVNNHSVNIVWSYV